MCAGLFRSSTPKPSPPLPVPTQNSADVAAAETAERLRRARAGGRVSTVLTGNLGLPTPAPVSRPILGGA